MSNPLRILRLLDQNLGEPTEMTLFGRSALALGFPQAPGHFHNTRDVDGILPLAWLEPPEGHQDFWQAGNGQMLRWSRRAFISRICFGKWMSSCSLIGSTEGSDWNLSSRD